MQGKYQLNYDTVAEVIAALAACGLFRGDQFQREIITYRRAQATYYSATATRKTVDIDDSIWLLTDADMAELSVKHCYYLKTHNQPINRVNQSNNEVNQSINSQSKVNKSKVNKTTTTTTSSKLESGERENQSSLSSSVLSDEEIEERQKKYGDATGQWEKILARPLTPFELGDICALVDEYGGQWVVDAMSVAGRAGKPKLNYVQGTLNKWKTDGRDAKKPAMSNSGAAESEEAIRASFMLGTEGGT